MKNYCVNCGKQIEGNEKFCSKCGNKLNNNNMNNNMNNKLPKKTDISLIGFIFSILGIITCGLTSLVGLIMSIMGLIDNKKKNEKKGLAVAGIILSGFMIFIWIIGFFAVIVFSKDVTVVDFSKMSYEESKEYCLDSELSCTAVEEYSDSVSKGKFISQSVETGKIIKSYETVEVIYSKGKKTTKKSGTNKIQNNKTNDPNKKTTNYKNLKSIKDNTLKNNFIVACNEIKMDITKIKSLKKKDDWNSGPRYTFNYDGQDFILYALDNGEVSSITIANNLLDKIYLDGYESVNVNDFMFYYSLKSSLQLKAEEKIKEYIKYPSTAKFKWTEYSYARRYDVYQITGSFKAKNAMGVEGENKFTIEFKNSNDVYSVVFLNINSESFIGSGSQLAEISRNEKKQSEKVEDNKIILKDGVIGSYGRKDKFDGEDYIRYYIPAGTYKVEAITKNAQFFIETIQLHKESGYDAATEIRKIKLAKVGDTDEFIITGDQCISLVMYTQVKLTKIN